MWEVVGDFADRLFRRNLQHLSIPIPPLGWDALTKPLEPDLNPREQDNEGWLQGGCHRVPPDILALTSIHRVQEISHVTDGDGLAQAVRNSISQLIDL